MVMHGHAIGKIWQNDENNYIASWGNPCPNPSDPAGRPEGYPLTFKYSTMK